MSISLTEKALQIGANKFAVARLITIEAYDLTFLLFLIYLLKFRFVVKIIILISVFMCDF